MRPRLLPSLLACLLSLPVPAALPAVAATPPRVMLPTRFHAGLDVAAFWVSEKLDGVRGRWDGRRLLTRGGEPIDAPAWFTAGWPRQPLDGELWIGRGRFEEVSALVRSLEADDAAWRQVRFMVYDLPDDPGRFGERVARMRATLGGAGVPWLRAVPQFRVADRAALDARLRAVVAAGGEGLVLHHDAAHYRAGRSEDLVKYKPHDDAEARVVGYSPGRGKYAGLLGALIVERADGLRFRIGTGFSDAERAHPPARGSWITYRFDGVTDHGTPRFARFLRVRHDPPPADPR
ncbi:MAG TPA: DNA ligase [Xanthomonadaceae bacterium]|nr:DNA ligase [Xanthomonadaceae bacterium]